jgi:hypothetical protein
MTTSAAEKRATSLLEELDAFVDQSIDSMSPKELKEFEKKRKRIMADVTSRAIDSGVPRGNDEQGRRVLQA